MAVRMECRDFERVVAEGVETAVELFSLSGAGDDLRDGRGT